MSTSHNEPNTPPDTDDLSLTPVDPSSLQSLSEQLALHRKAIEEEFEVIHADDDQATLEWARAYFRTQFVNSVKRIAHLVDYAEKDTTALRAAQFIYNEIKSADGGESDLEKLFRDLQTDPDKAKAAISK